MDVCFSPVARAAMADLGPERTVAFAHVLQRLPTYSTGRSQSFRCTLEGQDVRCQLRVSEYFPAIGAQILYAKMSDRLLILGFPEPRQSEAYDLNTIAESLKILSATNWVERTLRYDISAIPPEILARALAAARLTIPEVAATSQSMRYRGRGLFQLTGRVRYRAPMETSGDLFLTAHASELIERLLNEDLRAPEPQLVDDPALVDRLNRVTERAVQLADNIVEVARRWLSKPARDNFKAVMDAAVTQPQVVERGDDEIIVISKRLLHQYANPQSAEAIVEAFRTYQTSAPPLDLTDSDSIDVDDFELPAPQ